MYTSKVMPLLHRGGIVAALAFGRTHITKCDDNESTAIGTALMAKRTDMLQCIRPNTDDYQLVDWRTSKFSRYIENNALFDTLYGQSKVEAYEVYINKTKQEVYCVLKFGKSLNGHPGILHGGKCSIFVFCTIFRISRVFNCLHKANNFIFLNLLQNYQAYLRWF